MITYSMKRLSKLAPELAPPQRQRVRHSNDSDLCVGVWRAAARRGRACAHACAHEPSMCTSRAAAQRETNVQQRRGARVPAWRDIRDHQRTSSWCAHKAQGPAKRTTHHCEKAEHYQGVSASSFATLFMFCAQQLQSLNKTCLCWKTGS